MAHLDKRKKKRTPSKRKGAGAVVELLLPVDVADGLRETARVAGVTLDTVTQVLLALAVVNARKIIQTK